MSNAKKEWPLIFEGIARKLMWLNQEANRIIADKNEEPAEQEAVWSPTHQEKWSEFYSKHKGISY